MGNSLANDRTKVPFPTARRILIVLRSLRDNGARRGAVADTGYARDVQLVRAGQIIHPALRELHLPSFPT
jgi:hypothetical protein